MSSFPISKAIQITLCLAAFCFAACGKEDQFFECATDSECGSGQVCCFNGNGSECVSGNSCGTSSPTNPPAEGTAAGPESDPREAPTAPGCSGAQPTTGDYLTPCRDQGDCGEGLTCATADCLCVFL